MRRGLTIAIFILVLVLPTVARAGSYVLDLTGNPPADLGAAVAAAGGTLSATYPEIGVAIARSDESDFAARVAAAPGVQKVTEDRTVQWTPTFESAVADRVVLGDSTPPANAPQSAFFYACQWNLQQIDAPAAWAKGAFGDPGVKVAVIDSGVDPFHIDLQGRVDTANSASFLSPGSSPCGAVDETTFFDFDFHGTFVSGIITSNDLGTAGIAPQSTVVAVKALNCTGSGSFGDLIRAIMYAADLPDVDVINMSLGAYFNRQGGAGRLLGAVAKAVNYATAHGKLVVAAAGNEAADLDHDGPLFSIPAESGTTVSIYATSNLDGLASYSNHGVSGSWVGAPGGDFPNLLPPLAGCPVNPAVQSLILAPCSSFVCGGTNNYVLAAGTSFSSPAVAGVAALVDGEHGGALNAAQLKTILSQSADDLGAPGTDNVFSHGRVNAGSAVDH